jgi:acetyl-CoA synthetase
MRYGDRGIETACVALLLPAHGSRLGVWLFQLPSREPELCAETLGAMKAGEMLSPPSAALGPEPARALIEIGHAGVLATIAARYRHELASWRAGVPGLKLAPIIGDEAPEGCVPLGPKMAAA